jgi:uncharacterized integral membrane protein
MASHDKQPEHVPVNSEGEEHRYGRPPGPGDWKPIARVVALVALVVFSVLFFLTNRDSIEVSLVVATVTIPLIWILIGTFLLGAAVMYLLLMLRRRSARKARTK